MFLGKQFLKIDKWFPSSKTCSKSGNLKGHLKLPDSNYKCECCGIEIDRVKNDMNNFYKLVLCQEKRMIPKNTAQKLFLNGYLIILIFRKHKANNERNTIQNWQS